MHSSSHIQIKKMHTLNANGSSKSKVHIAELHPDDDPSQVWGNNGESSDKASMTAIISPSTERTSLLDLEHEENYALCPVEGCGEAVLLVELDGHVEMHEQEGLGWGDEGGLFGCFEGVERKGKVGDENVNLFAEGRKMWVDYLKERTAKEFGAKLGEGLAGLGGGEETETERQMSVKERWRSILKMPDVGSSGKGEGEGEEKKGKRLGVSIVKSVTL